MAQKVAHGSKVDNLVVKPQRRISTRNGFRQLYFILFPALVMLVIFKYIPILGIVIAFQDFNIFDGVFKSPFVGLDHFERLFSNPDFYSVLSNTLIINFYKLLFWVPLPVIFALFLNEVRLLKLRSTFQTTMYLPHFLSWVIVGGIFVNILAVNGGLINELIELIGGKPIKFMYDTNWFRHVIVASSMWKEVGWGTIVYLAAISSVDPQLYEQAKIDGASKIRQIWHITIPSITSTIVLMTLISLGNILSNSFEQILVMYNPAVYEVADVIETYVFRTGIGQMEYSYTTAVGIFSGLVGFILVISANTLCRKFLGRSLW